MDKATEKRGNQRVALHDKALVQLDGETLSCTTLNLALKGIGLESPVHREIGCRLRILFFLPSGGGWVRVDASLVREQQQKGRIIWGLQFSSLDSRTLGRIELFVRDQLRALVRARNALQAKRRGTPPPLKINPNEKLEIDNLYREALRSLKN